MLNHAKNKAPFLSTAMPCISPGPQHYSQQHILSKFFSVFFKEYVIAHTEYENYTYGNKSITKEQKSQHLTNLKHRLSTMQQHSSLVNAQEILQDIHATLLSIIRHLIPLYALLCTPVPQPFYTLQKSLWNHEHELIHADEEHFVLTLECLKVVKMCRFSVSMNEYRHAASSFHSAFLLADEKGLQMTQF